MNQEDIDCFYISLTIVELAYGVKQHKNISIIRMQNDVLFGKL